MRRTINGTSCTVALVTAKLCNTTAELRRPPSLALNSIFSLNVIGYIRAQKLAHGTHRFVTATISFHAPKETCDKAKKRLNIVQFAQKLRWDNYAVLIIQMAFFPPLSWRMTRQLPSSCSERSKRVLRSRTHTTRRRVHSVWSIDPRIDGSYVREKPYLQAPRRALTIGLAIINYVAQKENELLWVAITMLNAAAQLSMMLQNKYHLSKRSFIGDW